MPRRLGPREPLRDALLAPFESGGRTDLRIVALFVVIHAILLFNALIHDPRVGYDAISHLDYVETLAEFRLPTREDTLEFFSPPLPYVPPALLVHLGVDTLSALKGAQLANVVYSMALCLFLLKICDSLRPDAGNLKVLALGLLGMLPVYYKTFAFVRGEPLLAAAVVFTIHRAIVLFVAGSRRRKDILLLGLGLGLAVLSRQMGFFLFPPVVLLALVAMLQRPESHRAHLKAILGALVISAVIGGWYYGHLHATYGSITAFNREPAKQFALSNQSAGFFTDLALDRVFTDPIRNAFPNRLLPIFYSEVWGDYWCYFVVWGRNTARGRFISGQDLDRSLGMDPRPGWLTTNRREIGRYLGRVNLVSLLPSAVLIAGCLLSLPAVGSAVRLRADLATLVRLFLVLVVACTAAGYIWFLIIYPSPRAGRTIKATYVLHMFPLLCILAGDRLLRIRERSLAAFRALWTLLLACALHNLPVLFTHLLPW